MARLALSFIHKLLIHEIENNFLDENASQKVLW